LFVRAHLDRGLEFGSIWASLLWVLSMAGLPMSTSPTGRVIEIAAPGAHALARLAPFVSLAIGGGLAIWSARRGTGGEVADTSLAIGALAGAVGTSVVLSPQFFIWLCPLLIVAGSGLIDDRRFRVYAAVVVGAAVTTALVWPVLFRELHDMRPVPWALLAVRNVLVVVATVWLIRAAMSAPRSTR
jgi:hypothetical protein